MTDRDYCSSSTHPERHSSPNDSATKDKNIDNGVLVDSPSLKLTRKVLGITSSIDTNLPTEFDHKLTAKLRKCIEQSNIIQTDEEKIRTLAVLDKLNKTATAWIVELLKKKRMPEIEAKEVGGHIRTFGSYRIGVQSPGGDIDAVLIAPMHVERSDFFNSFSVYLKCRPEVKNLRCVTEAFVPIMKFNFCGIEFDLLFAKVISYKVDESTNFNDLEIFRLMDQRCVRSVTGYRIAEEILNLVPCPTNFRLLLYVIKAWAKSQSIYSNILGYLGGISWAILCARICQLYPTSTPSRLVEKFFSVYKQWNWGTTPVLLQKIVLGRGGLTFPQWSLNEARRNKLMSIITPCYPEQNSCHNVSLSTVKLISEKIEKADEIVSQVCAGTVEWNELFNCENFFHVYPIYFYLTAVSIHSAHDAEFQSLVESKLRYLINKLETNILIGLAQVHPHSFPLMPEEQQPLSRRWFIGIRIHRPEGSESAALNLCVRPEFDRFYSEVITKLNAEKNHPDKNILFGSISRKELKKYLSPEVIGKRSSSKRNGNSSLKEPSTSTNVGMNTPPFESNLKRKSTLGDIFDDIDPKIFKSTLFEHNLVQALPPVSLSPPLTKEETKTNETVLKKNQTSIAVNNLSINSVQDSVPSMIRVSLLSSVQEEDTDISKKKKTTHHNGIPNSVM